MNIGQIIKSKSSGAYTVIPNDVLKRPDISWQAKGLLSYLLSLPEDWVVYKEELNMHSSDGRHCTRSAFMELEEKGFILSVDVRNEKGHFKGRNYIVYEVPTFENPISENQTPIFENRISDNPISENHTLQSTNNTNTNSTKKNINKKILFDHFLILFNESTGREFKGDRKSRTAFEARLKEGFTMEQIVKAFQAASKDQYLTENGYLTPEYILRSDKLQRWINTGPLPTTPKVPLSAEQRWILKQEAEKRKEELSKQMTA